jgi:hypothetical protein
MPFALMLCMAGFGVPPVAAQQDLPNDLLIALDRSPCFGSCPVYLLTIRADGSFVITRQTAWAKSNLPFEPIMGKIEPEKVKDLLAEFRNIKFYSLQKQYGSVSKSKSGPNCPQYWTDAPTAEITISENGKRKAVSHYLGCDGAQILDDLRALETKIDEAVNIKQWESQLRWGNADVFDLKLKINPAKSSTPTKPQ